MKAVAVTAHWLWHIRQNIFIAVLCKSAWHNVQINFLDLGFVQWPNVYWGSILSPDQYLTTMWFSVTWFPERNSVDIPVELSLHMYHQCFYTWSGRSDYQEVKLGCISLLHNLHSLWLICIHQSYPIYGVLSWNFVGWYGTHFYDFTFRNNAGCVLVEAFGIMKLVFKITDNI